MKCLRVEQVVQRTGPVPGETQEEPGPESPHSARNLQVPQASPQCKSEHRRVKWPAAMKEREWRQVDEDVDGVLEATARSDADERLWSMSVIIVNIAAERFGRKEKRVPRNSGQNGIGGGGERARKHAGFIVNPFGFTKQLLGQKCSSHLECSKEEIDHHLRNTYSNNAREQDLGNYRALITPPEPTSEFNDKEPTLKQVQEIVRSARTSSAPGPSGVPYMVYKRCPRLLYRLWRILKVIWRRGKVAQQWRFSEGVWIPKEENSSNIEQFRTISLLSVEGKVFFSIIA
ncbi:hypothetical protein SKAU_G00166980 [Synaphobranchus kaupii]|uniref:Uncharacterized protein n=1 Tax=Synaphobranchus kaupii TaxID=118154 RepID=A0A9Q1FJM3_SYNKA|nr:hypothetical protein SKAU_G00166980 [Synaphobranchus kaupii]